MASSIHRYVIRIFSRYYNRLKRLSAIMDLVVIVALVIMFIIKLSIPSHVSIAIIVNMQESVSILFKYLKVEILTLSVRNSKTNFLNQSLSSSNALHSGLGLCFLLNRFL